MKKRKIDSIMDYNIEHLKYIKLDDSVVEKIDLIIKRIDSLEMRINKIENEIQNIQNIRHNVGNNYFSSYIS